MKRRPKLLHSLSRRETLKVCIVPATAVLGGRWLSGCSDANSGNDTLTTPDMSSSVRLDDASQSSVTGSATSAAMGGSGATSPAATAGAGGDASSSLPGNAGASAADGGKAPASTTAGAAGDAAHASAGTAAPSSASAAAGSPAVGGTGSAGTAGDAAAAGQGGTSSDPANMVAGPNVMWATGGTAMMASSYPDPFELGAGTACKLYPSQTVGPCYADDPMMRADISDGLDGLPVRLSFMVVGADGCTPIPNATVDIWHSGSQGIYSAYAMGTTCNPGSDNVLDETFCRGVQAVDETGRVHFATVFPGWYRGRTIHIHFTVRVGGRETVTSQLYFQDELVDEILAQGTYKARGKRDTTNARDGIFGSGGATPEQVIMETVKRPDGILHAWKVLSIG